MIEQIISLETAKLAKKAGYNISAKSFYGCDYPAGGEPNKLMTIELKKVGLEETQDGTLVYSAPTQSMLQRWLREYRRIHVPIWFNKLTEKYRNELLNPDDREFPTYEESLEFGLHESLKMLIE